MVFHVDSLMRVTDLNTFREKFKIQLSRHALFENCDPSSRAAIVSLVAEACFRQIEPNRSLYVRNVAMSAITDLPPSRDVNILANDNRMILLINAIKEVLANHFPDNSTPSTPLIVTNTNRCPCVIQ